VAATGDNALAPRASLAANAGAPGGSNDSDDARAANFATPGATVRRGAEGASAAEGNEAQRDAKGAWAGIEEGA